MDVRRFLTMAIVLAASVPPANPSTSLSASERWTCKCGTGYASVFTSGTRR